jgi:hypothetical protein
MLLKTALPAPRAHALLPAFGVFAERVVRSQVNWLAATEAYVDEVRAIRPASPGSVTRTR